MAAGLGKKIVVWVLSVLLALVFLGAGSSKLMGVEAMVEGFRNWGYPDWFRLLIGAGEVGGAILLLIPSLAWIGATGLSVIMVGAIYTHLTHNETTNALAPLILLILLGVVGYLRCPGWLRRRSGGASGS